MAASLWGAALVQRWGPIRVNQAGLALSAMGLGLMVVPQVAVAALGALLLGLGYGPITPASSQMLARTTPPERYGLVFSVKQTGVPLGGVLAGLLVPPVLLRRWHWWRACACCPCCWRKACAAFWTGFARQVVRCRAGGSDSSRGSWSAVTRYCVAWPPAPLCFRWCNSAWVLNG